MECRQGARFEVEFAAAERRGAGCTCLRKDQFEQEIDSLEV